MRRFALFVVALALGATTAVGTACRTSPRGAQAPPVSQGLPPEVVEAQRAIRDLHSDEAVRILLRAGGVSADAPERSWLLIDLWTARCEVPRARATVDALPPSPMARVLQAHARRDPAQRITEVGSALRTSVSAWAHLETALALAEQGGRGEAVQSHAARAASMGPAFVRREASLLAGSEALEHDHAADAMRWAKQAHDIDPADPRAPSLMGRAAARLGQISEGALLAWQTLKLQPKSGRAARRVADLLREGAGPGVEKRIRAEISPWLADPKPPAEILALLGLLAERAGEDAAAIDRYQRALAAGADPVPVDRHLRHLLFGAGRRAEGVALLKAAVPPEAFSDPRNLRRDAWAALDRASTSDPSGLELARALRGVGALEDAALLLKETPGVEAGVLRTQLAGELAFERAFRATVEDGYRAPAAGRKPPTLDQLRRHLYALAREHLPASEAAVFEPGPQGVRTVPFLGTWIDHSADTSSPLVAWFRARGQYLMLGQREGTPPEAILLSLASSTRQQEIRTQGHVYQHDLAIGFDRSIRSYIDYRGGALSGAALPDGIWLDADAARREDHTVRSTLAILDADFLAKLAEAGRDAPRVDGPDGPFALDDAGGVAIRLARRYAARVGRDPWGSFSTLKAHESGHVLDLERHLPILQKLPATVALLASEGFAIGNVEGRLEGRAQLASVADSRDPDLALYEMVRVLPNVEDSPEAHERGYRAVVAGMVRWLARNAARFPAIDPTRKLLPQLDRLTPEEIRTMAHGLQAEGWSSAGR